MYTTVNKLVKRDNNLIYGAADTAAHKNLAASLVLFWLGGLLSALNHIKMKLSLDKRVIRGTETDLSLASNKS